MKELFTSAESEFIDEVEAKTEFLGNFQRLSYGIIALKYGYTLEESRRAGLLKDDVLV